MPYCSVTGAVESAAGDSEVRIFYRTYGHGPIKVLLIIGLAGTHDSWGPQIRGLAGTDIPNDEKSTVDGEDSSNARGIKVCAFDNRGMGRSSVPTKRSDYTTTIMAKDAIALMDHLGWRRAHVFGHSMVLSLALLNVTGGGFQCLPKLDRLTLSVAVRFLLAKTPEERAAVDLDTHYSQDFLEECVGQSTRREILYQASESKTSTHDWTNLDPKKSSGDWMGTWKMMAVTKSMTRSSSLASLYKVLERLNRLLISILGVFLILYEFLRRLVGKIKPVKVGTPLT